MDTIAERLKSARLDAGLTQDELGEKLNWGAGQRRSSHYERGRSVPSFTEVVKIANLLNVTPAWLAFGDQSGNDTKSVGNHAEVMMAQNSAGDYFIRIENSKGLLVEVSLAPDEFAKGVTGKLAKATIVDRSS